MRRTFAIAALLGLALSASSASAISCLNSKPCGDRCIPFHTICHIKKCRAGYWLCKNDCIPDHVLCRIG